MINKSRRRKLVITERPLPRKNEAPFTAQLREAFTAMKPGESFLLNTRDEQVHALRIAKRVGIKIVTRKINGSGFQIELPQQRLQNATLLNLGSGLL